MAKLAINGGEAVKTRPFKNWPIVDMEKTEEALKRVLYTKKWGSLHGEETKKFGEEFASFQDAHYGIPCSNGTIALIIALQAAGIGPGDEVILPSYSFIATATAVVRVGAIPVFVDLDPDSYTISIESIKQNITTKTKAIMPVHIGGRPADMDTINSIAKEHSLKVIEDSAQGWGAVYKGKKVGALGNCGGFSFQSSKNITSAEGGIVLTNHENLADLIESWTNCGRKKDGLWYGHYLPASNFRITEFQTAILRVQLQDYPNQLDIRRRNAKYLDSQLNDFPGLDPIQFSEDYQSSYHFYIMKYKKDQWNGLSRAKFIEAMRKEGFFIHPGYSLPIHKQPVFDPKEYDQKNLIFGAMGIEKNYQELNLPETEKACDEESIWIPQWVMLGEKEEIEQLFQAIEKIRTHLEELL